MSTHLGKNMEGIAMTECILLPLVGSPWSSSYVGPITEIRGSRTFNLMYVRGPNGNDGAPPKLMPL